MIKMLPSLNYDPKDPKFNLLDKIFKIIHKTKKKIYNFIERVKEVKF